MVNETTGRVDAIEATGQDLAKEAYGSIVGNRVVQLCAGVITMMVISNYQYAFTLFTPGLKQQFASIPYAQIALIFSLFVLFETWPIPIAGILIDRFRIRTLMAIGSCMVLLGWLLGGTAARSVTELYLYYGVLTGTGAGIAYIAAAGNAVKWFPDRRGLAAGFTSAGFGGGATLSIIPISASINSMGWAKAMALWGVILGGILFAMAMILRHPPKGWMPTGWAPKVSSTIAQTKMNYTWQQALCRREFYFMYFMFLVMTTGGLMTIGNLSEVARSLSVQNTKILGISIVAMTATINGITNALSRIMWGTISDKIGRANTMAIAFSLEGVLILLVTQIVGNPIFFVLLLPFVFLSWGETSSLIPACLADVFGPRYVTATYGLLYTSKGFSAILGGWGAAALVVYFGGRFQVPYYIAGIFDIIAGMLAFVALKPAVRRALAQEAKS